MHTATTYAVILVLVAGCLTMLAQSVLAQSKPAEPAPQAAIPQLDHFDVTQVDSSLDPCVDFYQYTCKKWIAKNPIPNDQANWWLGSKLMIWNRPVHGLALLIIPCSLPAPIRPVADLSL